MGVTRRPRPSVSFALAPTVLSIAWLTAARPATPASLEVYGQLPTIDMVALSPDASRIAFVRSTDGTRLIQVASVEDHRVLNTLRVHDQKLRSLEWADEDHLLILTSATDLPRGLVGKKGEWSMLQVYDVARNRVTAVPHPAGRGSTLRLMNVVSGRLMVRRLKGHTILFLPGRCVYRTVLPALIRVDLEDGRETVIRRGETATQRWLVDADGEVVAEEDYYDKDRRWVLQVRRSGLLAKAATIRTEIDVPNVLGFGPGADSLVVRTYEDGFPVWKLAGLHDGTFGASVPGADHQTLTEPIRSALSDRVVGGVGVSADGESQNLFFDAGMQARWEAVRRAFDGALVSLVSASSDFGKVVVLVDGPKHGLEYVLVDLESNEATLVGKVYTGLTEPLEVRRIVYRAADGLRISAFLTLPPGRPPRKLPLVVLPHGGPAARDGAGFDWWSQALADQGYAVLRPNYRGSSLSSRFLAAGYGEWGRKMQTDLSDGVRHLVEKGIVDPARVCIVGASYGGYAALAGVALQPSVYRCAVSVAGLSDLKRMLEWSRLQYSDLAQRYWDRFMGVSGPGDPALDVISPIKHVEAVRAPVLLVHGRDDTVVPLEQSERMAEALRRARKDVEFVRLPGEDHWLSRGATRLQMLQASVAFLRAHNPPD
jgi:dipeptidyl aminopeptidase/acylaminoacyl peptidase